MKREVFIVYALLIVFGLQAQSPEKMSYQAIIRNGSGNLVANTAIGMRISILQGTAAGTAVYEETQTPTTTASGLVSLEIGSGTVVSGTFAGINWGADAYFLKTETDLAGGTNYTISGTSQFISVPYALNAKTAQTVTGLANGKLYVGNASGAATQVSVSGDATMNDAGILTIGANAIGSAEVSDNSLTATDLGTGSVGSDEIADGTIANADLNKANIPLSGFGAAAAAVAMGGNKLTGLADPTAAQEAATKAYVDALEAKLKVLKLATGYDVEDIDGNYYNGVSIGTQVWMAENLKTTRYSDGTVIPHVTDNAAWNALTATDKAYSYYGDPSPGSNADTYGALYTWAAAMNGASSSSAAPSGVQGVCPTGWHVPSNAEWKVLTDFLGGVSVAGGKLKEAGTTHWTHPNTGATNEAGFTALPGGYRYYYGTFNDVGNNGSWWPSTEYTAATVESWDMLYDVSNVSLNQSTHYKNSGFSVRCLRD